MKLFSPSRASVKISNKIYHQDKIMFFFCACCTKTIKQQLRKRAVIYEFTVLSKLERM